VFPPTRAKPSQGRPGPPPSLSKDNGNRYGAPSAEAPGTPVVRSSRTLCSALLLVRPTLTRWGSRSLKITYTVPARALNQYMSATELTDFDPTLPGGARLALRGHEQAAAQPYGSPTSAGALHNRASRNVSPAGGRMRVSDA
jgi:molybdopterin biosynthesis enzyme